MTIIDFYLSHAGFSITIIGFYFSNSEKWIEYNSNGITKKDYFASDEELLEFIRVNNLPLKYKGCIDC